VGWASLPYETAEDGTWWIPASVVKRQEDSTHWLEEPVELRITLEVEQWLLPRGISLPQTAPSGTLTFTAHADSAELEWQSRFLASVHIDPTRFSVEALAQDCNTPRCNDREIEAARTAIPLLTARDVDPYRFADWAMELALDSDLWYPGFDILRYSKVPDLHASKTNAAKPELVPLLRLLSVAQIDQLVLAALREDGLSWRFVETARVLYRANPPELVASGVERVGTELSRGKTTVEVLEMIEILVEITHPSVHAMRTSPDRAWVDRPEDEAIRLLSPCSDIFSDDESSKLVLWRHAWAGLVSSGRLGQAEVAVEWWRPDIVPAAYQYIQRMNGGDDLDRNRVGSESQ
jgi:hypothetical protein